MARPWTRSAAGRTWRLLHQDGDFRVSNGGKTYLLGCWMGSRGGNSITVQWEAKLPVSCALSPAQTRSILVGRGGRGGCGGREPGPASTVHRSVELEGLSTTLKRGRRSTSLSRPPGHLVCSAEGRRQPLYSRGPKTYGKGQLASFHVYPPHVSFTCFPDTAVCGRH